jgi:hypothetical protein
MNEFMSFSTYYLEFLVQDCHFIIDELKEMAVFNSSTAYNIFTNYFFDERMKAKRERNKLMEQFCKIVLNASYGMDALNTEKYNRSVLVDRNIAFINQLKDTFVSTEQLDGEMFLQQLKPHTIKCQTALASAYFTLDNGKYWVLNFIYNCLNKCLDKKRFHFIETDTDSLYFAVAGDKEKGIGQGFNEIVLDTMLWTFIEKELLKEKKLLGFAVEKTGSEMYAIAPKQYAIYNGENETLKNKGINMKVSAAGMSDYVDVISNGNSKEEKNIIELRTIGGKKVKLALDKWSLTGIHNKMKVMSNGVCYPFI